jgi:hypothetical protein
VVLVYDLASGRRFFLSADPIVQDAGYSQTYNRYSYCINNPLGYTDPSGYSFWDRVKDAFKLNIFLPGVVLDPLYWFAPQFHAQYGGQALGIAAGAVVLFFTASPMLAAAANGFASGFAGSLLNGGSLGDAFKAGAIGAGYGAAVGFAGYVAGPIASAAVSGWISENNGGEFGAGFYSSLVGSIGGNMGNHAGTDNWYAGLVVSAVAGGTAAEIGGGKFANGAATAAFQYIIYNPPTQEQLGFSFQDPNSVISPATMPANGIIGDADRGQANYLDPDTRLAVYNQAVANVRSRNPDLAAIEYVPGVEIRTNAIFRNGTSLYPEAVYKENGLVVVDLTINRNTSVQFVESMIVHGFTHANQYLTGNRMHNEYDAYKAQWNYERTYHGSVLPVYGRYLDSSGNFLPESAFNTSHQARTGQAPNAPVTVAAPYIVR